jgi:hypothetical protein
MARTLRLDKANNMITLTAIVLALGLGWAIIKAWNAMAAETKPAAPPSETAKQV